MRVKKFLAVLVTLSVVHLTPAVATRPMTCSVTQTASPPSASPAYWPGSDARIAEPHANGYTRFAAGEPYTDTTELIDADASGGYIDVVFAQDNAARRLLDRTICSG